MDILDSESTQMIHSDADVFDLVIWIASDIAVKLRWNCFKFRTNLNFNVRLYVLLCHNLCLYDSIGLIDLHEIVDNIVVFEKWWQ